MSATSPSLTALAQQLGATGVGPQFIHALELLVQAHVQGLRASNPDAEEKDPGIDAEEKDDIQNVVDVPVQEPSEDYSEPDIAAATKQTTPQGENSLELSHGVDSLRLNRLVPNQRLSTSSSPDFSTQRSFMPPTNRRSAGIGSMISTQNGVSFLLRNEVELDEEEYDVTNYYHSQGVAQKVARSHAFGHLTLAVIAINALYMGVESDMNDSPDLNEADWYFVLLENFFCVFYTVELLVRLGAFNGKRNCLKDGWFKFDAFLLFVIWLETWIMTLILKLFGGGAPVSSGPLRLLRLLRLARLVRLMRAFPELLTMISGMIVATRAVGSAMLLLVFAIYAWGITMHSFMKNDEKSEYLYWGSVTRCMMTLMSTGTLGDEIGTVMRQIVGNVPAFIALLTFVVFSSLTLLNMLIGVMCEVVTEVAAVKKETHALSLLKINLLGMLKRIDVNGNGMVDRTEVLNLINDEHALTIMEDLKINAGHFVDVLEMYFESSDSLSIPCIMQLLVDNQGWRPTTVFDLCQSAAFHRWTMRSDLMLVQKQLLIVHADLADDVRNLQSPLLAIQEELASIRGSISKPRMAEGQRLSM